MSFYKQPRAEDFSDIEWLEGFVITVWKRGFAFGSVSEFVAIVKDFVHKWNNYSENQLIDDKLSFEFKRLAHPAFKVVIKRKLDSGEQVVISKVIKERI